MLTGQRPFQGEDVSLTLAAVMTFEPDLDLLPETLSPTLTTYLTRCLAKDPKERVRDIGDVRLALAGGFDTTATTSSATEKLPSTSRPRAVAWTLACVAVGGVLGGLAVWSAMPERSVPVSRLTVSQATPPLISQNGHRDIAISPDGAYIVYPAAENGSPQLLLRRLSELNGAPLRGGVGDNPFFSPDGTWVGFTDGSSLQRVSTTGGDPQMICELPAALRGATWITDQAIVFATASGRGLMRVAATGGDPVVISTPEGGGRHYWPSRLPGGVSILFSTSNGPSLDDDQIAVLDTATGEHQVIIERGSAPSYVPTGHIVYTAGDGLSAVAFDPDSLEVTGEPVPLLDDVMIKTTSGAANLDLSDNGSLAYVSGAAAGALGENFVPVWADRLGNEEPLDLPPATYSRPKLSPDGNHLAVTIGEQGQYSLWVYELATGRGLRLSEEGSISGPVWTPDGERIVFSQFSNGNRDLYWVAADGSGEVESLIASEENDQPAAVTPDGRTLIFSRDFGGGRVEVWTVPLDGERLPALVHESGQRLPNNLSRDGHWLAYDSNESGRREVYVEPYPGPGPKVPVSIGGGADARWSPDGAQLYYRRGTDMMAVDVTTDGGTFRVASPTLLFPAPSVGLSRLTSSRQYDVASDGQFLLLKSPLSTIQGVSPSVVLVQNWFEELKERVPTP